ncbi:hypothetical protein GCM10009119_25340 [Algoriphagus jejuensis]|uniref:Phosphatidylglycerol:prolipoprotein diacylglycerol transferase n=2 Tax=Algoriphagus jejuensis TaxID=419934 RepID=A0ABP3YDW2_9BACT
MKIPLVSWLLVLAISRLFFIIGTKVIAFSFADWVTAVYQLELPQTTEKVIIGGFALGLAAFFVAIRLFKIHTGSLDAMAIAIPVSIAIQRIGCLILGCCFGTSTHMPWGVNYGFGSPPHFHQFQVGLIEATATSTTPIHPFQLYEALNGIFVAVLLLIVRKKVKSQGGLFLISIGVWAGIRTIIEFFRDPYAHAMGGEIWGGLKVMQWILFGVSLFALGYFYLREKKWRLLPASNYSDPPKQAAVWLVLMISVCMTWLLRNWLTGPELFAMNLMLIPALFISAFYLFKENTIPSFRWATLALMVLPLLLMSQTLKENLPSDSTRTRGYDFFNVGFSSGDYYSETSFLLSGPPSGCGSSRTFETFRNEYWNAGFGYGRTKISEKDAFSYGANISMGQYGEEKISTAITSDRFLFSINPYVQYDVKWFGIGGGLHIGNLYWTRAPENLVDTPSPDTGTLKSPIYPQAYMRIGPEHILFADGGLANSLPSPFPSMRAEIALGSGFGLPKGNKLRVGTSNFGEFIQAQALITKSWQASATYSWRNTHYYIGTSQEALNRQFFVNLQYRFNYKE